MGIVYVLNENLVPRVYHWNAFSITRVYLTKTDVSAFASAVVSDYKKLGGSFFVRFCYDVSVLWKAVYLS